MLEYHFITTVLALVNLLAMALVYEGKRITSNFTLMTLLMALSNAGFFARALSTELSEAVLANKIGYLSGCFMPPIFLFAICAICNYQMRNWIRNLLLFYSFVVYGTVLTIGYSDIYYADIWLGRLGNATTLEHTYGPAHNLFYTILYGYIIIEVVLLLYCLKKKRTVSRKNLYAMILMELMNIVLYVGMRAIEPGLEVMPLVYVMDGWIALYLSRRTMLYNVEDSALSSATKQELSAYIMFDNHLNFIGANELAQNVFPTITDCKVDKPINGTPGVEIILAWVHEYAQSAKQTFSYESGERHFQCTIGRIWHKEQAYGYTVKIQDDTDRWNYINLLSTYNSELETQVKQKTEHIVTIQSQVLLGMANIVENKDGSTGGHIKRTSDVIKILLETIQKDNIFPMSDEFKAEIIKAAPMHDLGKLSIDDSILKKPARLTPEEFAVMKTHPEKSALFVESILRGVKDTHFVQVAINVAKYHHEKWDGTGYPEQLKGETIPIEARIMAVADVYDALVSKRCYKEPMSFDEAFRVMQGSMGVQFDPQMEQVLTCSRAQLEAYYSQADG